MASIPKDKGHLQVVWSQPYFDLILEIDGQKFMTELYDMRDDYTDFLNHAKMIIIRLLEQIKVATRLQSSF